MRVAAIIPARANSKRLPMKNLRRLAGRSLLSHAILAAEHCDEVWVSTDGADIATEAAAWRATVLLRPSHLATDSSPTEDTIAHWLRSMPRGDRPSHIVLLQPSTPILRDASEHVRLAVRALIDGGHDSVVAVEQDAHRAFDGRIYAREDGLPEWRPFRPVMTRPRTQDVRPQGTECGAFWVFTREHFERTGCRQGGDCRAYVLPKWSCVDIDDELDLRAAESLLAMRRGVVASGGCMTSFIAGAFGAFVFFAVVKFVDFMRKSLAWFEHVKAAKSALADAEEASNIECDDDDVPPSLSREHAITWRHGYNAGAYEAHHRVRLCSYTDVANRLEKAK
jgi:CMP-N-acetylneuraminic acid synthetase